MFRKAGDTVKETKTNARGKKSTITTLAEELGVSPSTVSRAFNPDSKISDEVRRKILSYAKQQNYVPNLAASRLSMKAINIGLLFTSHYGYATDEFLRGVDDGYRELHDLKINLVIKVLDRGDTLLRDVREALEQFSGFDGLIVSGLTGPEELEALDRFAAGVSVVTLQTDAPQIGRLFASCHDPVMSSRLAAEFIGDCLRKAESRNVALFTGDRASDLHRKASDAFMAAARDFGLNVVCSYDMMDSPEVLKEQLRDMRDARGLRPDGIYITSGQSMELCRLVEESGWSGDTVLVTFDVNRETVDYLRRGVIWGIIYQNLYQQAKNAFTYLARHIIGESAAGEIVSPVPELVLKSNLAYYVK